MRRLEGIRELGLATALLLVMPAAAAEEERAPCEDSGQCRARFGNGSVCTTGRCEPYRDETDLFIAVGLTEKTQARPRAFEPLLAVLPAFAYNPTVGFIFGGTLAGDAFSGSIYMGEYLNAKFTATRRPYPAGSSAIVLPGGPPLAN